MTNLVTWPAIRVRAICRKLRLVCREYDFISRMGGDEFVVVTPGWNRKAAEEICRRVKTAAAESAREVCDRGDLSASVGVAFFPEDANDAEQLLVTQTNGCMPIRS